MFELCFGLMCTPLTCLKEDEAKFVRIGQIFGSIPRGKKAGNP